MISRKTVFTLLLLTLFAASASADPAALAPEGTMARKFQRGFLNILLSPFDISAEMAKEKKNDTFPPSWAIGAGRGVGFMAGRALSGVYDIVTFPLPLPAKYEGLVQPEMPWELFNAAEKPELPSPS